MLKTIRAGIVALALLAAMPAWADELTNEQIQTLIGSLRLLDGGSVAQCAPAKEPKPDAKPSACPYRKSAKLIEAMARDIVALDAADRAFKIQVNAIRAEVLAGEKTPGPKDEAEFMARLQKINAQVQSVPALSHVKLADLDIGPSPEHNDVPAIVLAGLAPIIDDFGEARK